MRLPTTTSYPTFPHFSPLLIHCIHHKTPRQQDLSTFYATNKQGI